MANQEHVDRLLQGVGAWNRWREENPEIKPDLSNAMFKNVSLSGADLKFADLSCTSFSDANLSHAALIGTDLSGANLSRADLSSVSFNRANLSETNLSGAYLVGAYFREVNFGTANLSEANLSEATFSRANLSGSFLRSVNFRGAKLSSTDLSFANLHQANFSRADLDSANLCHANLCDTYLVSTDLSDANLSNANLSGAIFTAAKLIATNLSGANLSSADLSAVQALQANFQAATLTGACIEDWHINSRTNLQEVICEYIFTKSGWNEGFTDRLPHDPNQIFAPGEFAKRYQIVLETVDLFFNDGIDWKAFLASLDNLQTEYGNEINIQGIEKRAGETFLVRLEVPSEMDKGTIEQQVKASYEANLKQLEAQYHAELQTLKIQHSDEIITLYRQHNAEMKEITKLLASKPITVEAKAVAENHSSFESYTNNFTNSPIGNFANKMQDQASQQTNQYIGANLDEITTLIQSLRSKAESFPEAQRSEAIDHLTDLTTDLEQPPEKRKPSRMKAALLALVGIATAVSGAVTNTNDFVGQVQELSEKLGMELPIAQPQSQDAIDTKAISTEQP